MNLPLPQPELYDLESDPGEDTDVAEDNPEIVAQIRTRMEEMLLTFPENIISTWRDTMRIPVEATESGALRERISQLLAAGHNKIVLDLKEVEYIDSTGLGAMVIAFTQLNKSGGSMKLSVRGNSPRLLLPAHQFGVAGDAAGGDGCSGPGR